MWLTSANSVAPPPETSLRISMLSAPSASASQDIAVGCFGPSASNPPGIRAADRLPSLTE